MSQRRYNLLPLEGSVMAITDQKRLDPRGFACSEPKRREVSGELQETRFGWGAQERVAEHHYGEPADEAGSP